MIQFSTGLPKAGGTFIVLPPGSYPFEVVDAVEKASSSGNSMIELKLRVDGKAVVFDNLVFTTSAMWKVDQFLKAVGVHPGEGQEVSIDAHDFIGQKGTATIKVGKNQKGLDRNEVDGYTWGDEF